MLRQKIISSLFTFGLICTPMAAHAQQQTEEQAPMLEAGQAKPMAEMTILPDLKQHAKTNPEVVIFSQYKLAQAVPDIDEFAKLSRQGARNWCSAVTIAEYNRMSNRYDLARHRRAHTITTGWIYSLDLIVFDELSKKTYFNYPVWRKYYRQKNKSQRIKISKNHADQMAEAAAEFWHRNMPTVQPFTLDGHHIALAKDPFRRNPTNFEPSNNQELNTLFTGSART